MMSINSDIIKKRILITGANGVLGSNLAVFYSEQENIELCLTARTKGSNSNDKQIIICDITNREQVKKIILDFYPDFVINAAAFTNVDLCETEKEISWKVNVKTVEYIAEACRAVDAHLIHISSDYVFDGKQGPYNEVDKTNPVSYYGRTKLASENALKISGINYSIIRTNVLYGAIEKGKADFVYWVIQSLENGKDVNIVTDQFNNPTFVEDLVHGINKLIEFKRSGIFHIGGRDFLTRFEFTNLIAEHFDLNKNLIHPILTKELNQAAIRPLKSGLVTLKAETQINYKPHTIIESFEKIKSKIIL